MNLQELRIGNWIYISNEEGMKFPHLINPEYFKSDYHGNESPIPLTPDILERAGFENAYSAFHDERYIYNLKTNATLHFQWDSDYDAIIVSNENSDDGMMFGCRYLHQLQNLYFALTGKELEITL